MLEEFFTPKSVAVVGASTSPEKLGYAVLENLVNGGYVKVGKIYPINPKADQILGQKAYPSVLDVPGEIDLAVIVIPYTYVPDVLKDCGKKNIAGVISPRVNKFCSFSNSDMIIPPFFCVFLPSDRVEALGNRLLCIRSILWNSLSAPSP